LPHKSGQNTSLRPELRARRVRARELLARLQGESVVAPHLTVADVKGRSIVIHAGGDNYSDQPAPLGGGGARIARGVAK
jgi:Cu/Zn superoxide dismutase